MGSNNQPTPAQLKYATDLMRKLGCDRDRYKLERMTKKELSSFIDGLKWKLEGLR